MQVNASENQRPAQMDASPWCPSTSLHVDCLTAVVHPVNCPARELSSPTPSSPALEGILAQMTHEKEKQASVGNGR